MSGRKLIIAGVAVLAVFFLFAIYKAESTRLASLDAESKRENTRPSPAAKHEEASKPIKQLYPDGPPEMEEAFYPEDLKPREVVHARSSVRLAIYVFVKTRLSASDIEAYVKWREGAINRGYERMFLNFYLEGQNPKVDDAFAVAHYERSQGGWDIKDFR